MTTAQTTTRIQLEHTEIILRLDGIIQVISSNHEYSAEDLKEIHEAILKLNNQKKAYILAIASRFTQITDEGRKYLSTEEGSHHSIASAFVIQSLSQRILVNFLIKVQGRPIPTRFFTDIDEAVNWLVNLELKIKS